MVHGIIPIIIQQQHQPIYIVQQQIYAGPACAMKVLTKSNMFAKITAHLHMILNFQLIGLSS